MDEVPSLMTVMEWTFSGWVETRFVETTEVPAYYAPGEEYTVTGNATLYALFTRVEGSGDLRSCSQLHVTNSLAPSVDGVLTFFNACDLRGDYEISASNNECSCIYFNAAGQDISGLKLKLVNPKSFDKEQKYRILRAPNGYTGTFNESALPSGWTVVYETNNVYLKFPKPFVIVVR